MKTETTIELLKRCSFLGGLSDDILSALAERAGIEEITKDQTLITKGETGSTMYFIVSGEVRVHDEKIVLATLEEGEVFGEMAVLDSEVRSASVTAQSDTTLISLEREVLWDAVAASPEAFKTIIRSVMQREREIVRNVTSRTEQVLAFEKEMEIGRRIQADFLPKFIPEVEHWEIASHFEAAREVAGDFFDVFRLKSSNHLALVIGDVCDKGVGAALFMTLFRSLIRASCLYGFLNRTADTSDTEGAPDAINDILLNAVETTNLYIATTHGQSSMFASVFFGLLNPDSGELIYINGGHESPIIFRAGGGHEILEVTGGVLGLFPGARFTIASAQLNAGDLIFTYTDGVNEAKNESGEQFTDDRILQLASPEGTSPADFLAGMLEQVVAFRGDAAQSDDITMLALRWLAGPADTLKQDK